MKNRLLQYLFCIAIMVLILFTRNSEVIFLGDDQPCFNYGFPLQSFITDANGSVIHIYSLNIFANIIFFLPMFCLSFPSFLKKKYQRANNTLIVLFCMGAFTLLLPWKYKSYSFYSAIIFYVLWLILFCLLFLLPVLGKKKREGHKSE